MTGSVSPIDRSPAAAADRRTSPSRRGGYPATAIPALVALLDDLADHAVPYCLWKSNLHLGAALAGRTDLDVLVDRDAATAFREILAHHGMKPLAPAPGAAYPAMEHHLGMDRVTGQLFHLHVHFQLVLGERYVKNYRIPLEREFLETTRALDGVPIPRADLDLAMLAMRALLKYRLRDLVKDELRIRSPGIPLEVQTEIAWLRADVHPTPVDDTTRRGSTYVPAAVVPRFLEVLADRPRSGVELMRLRGRLRRALRHQQRRGRLHATAGYSMSVLRRRRHLVRRRFDPRMTPAGGGLTVGVIGSDGSGKSTLTAATREWLDWKLAARVHYMGSKEPSRNSRWSYLAFRALRRANRAARANGFAARSTRGLRDLVLAMHHVSIGHDRARRYREGVREARAGSIVLFDRFPVECMSRSEDHRLLDGPQIATLLRGSAGPLVHALAAVERRMYERYEPPDVLVVLVADADVAAGRKPDHDHATIDRKRTAVVEVADLAAARGVRVVTVDANEPFGEVLHAMKVGLWDAM